MPDNFQIHQIMPCTIPMTAVFYNLDDDEIYRLDVLCLAVVHCYEEQETPPVNDKTWVISNPIPESYIRPMVGDDDGYIDDAEFIDGFLGVEYSGVLKNWDAKIRDVREEMEKIEKERFVKRFN